MIEIEKVNANFDHIFNDEKNYKFSTNDKIIFFL